MKAKGQVLQPRNGQHSSTFANATEMSSLSVLGGVFPVLLQA